MHGSAHGPPWNRRRSLCPGPLTTARLHMQPPREHRGPGRGRGHHSRTTCPTLADVRRHKGVICHIWSCRYEEPGPGPHVGQRAAVTPSQRGAPSVQVQWLSLPHWERGKDRVSFLPFCFTVGSGSTFSRHILAELSSETLAELVLASFVPDRKQCKTSQDNVHGRLVL